ncbi:hypothetical protein Salat_2920100 [Sesamum alatum]|uniref:CCHC-type domain-containing protein n=1 Tax=Sesamum alatum TaxID=300844 RepID=A0AAE2C892_9LAMI|nr:hypothetical protein Salat_2920100 [Sesamum alatum]
MAFTYEKLPTFCYGCGILGHIYRDCAQRLDAGFRERDESKLPYGAWLRETRAISGPPGLAGWGWLGLGGHRAERATGERGARGNAGTPAGEMGVENVGDHGESVRKKEAIMGLNMEGSGRDGRGLHRLQRVGRDSRTKGDGPTLSRQGEQEGREGETQDRNVTGLKLIGPLPGFRAAGGSHKPTIAGPITEFESLNRGGFRNLIGSAGEGRAWFSAV